MAEKCAKCNAAAARVEIGGRSYCGSCGEPKSLAKAKSVRTMSDLGKHTALPVSARPASSFHSHKGLAKGGVVDLRTPRTERPKIQQLRKPVQKVRPNELTLPLPNEKIATAKHMQRSEHISRFHQPSNSPITATPDKSLITPQRSFESIATSSAHQKLPPHAETHHRAMASLAGKKNIQTDRTGAKTRTITRYAAIGTAVLIMSGYVWLQNYPKLELHSASGKAGFALTLPSYLPSSYSLGSPVAAVRGKATLSFNSPSSTAPLKITQETTTWDSSSLLDNVVTTKTNDYTSVQGQGLTIYLWGKNQATWVNHGVMYGIEGASQLSREQLLKVAYSL